MLESGCHVATFQRRDVPTSRRSNVATFQRRNVPTSRRSNIATYPRRDVSTSRRWVNRYRSQQSETSRHLNVPTSQRRAVATSRRQHGICTSSFKALMVQNWGASGGGGTRARNSRVAVTQTLKKCPGFVLFLIFWILE